MLDYLGESMTPFYIGLGTGLALGPLLFVLLIGIGIWIMGRR